MRQLSAPQVPAPACIAEVPSPPYGEIIVQVRAAAPGGLHALYRLVTTCTQIYFRRRAPSEAEDLVHDVFLAVVEGIRRTGINRPECLLGYISTVAHRRLANHIDFLARRRQGVQPEDAIPDHSINFEQLIISEQHRRIAASLLRGLSPRDREILTRFYIHCQPKEHIIVEMNLTETQFRLIKSRAKASFAARAQHYMNRAHVREG